MPEFNSYEDKLRKTKSLVIITALQKRRDLSAVQAIADFDESLHWEPLTHLMISASAWDYIVNQQKLEPKFVFCHPDILMKVPVTSLFYRGLSALSLKAVNGYCGAVESHELGVNTKLRKEKAVRLAQVYNAFTCSVIENSEDWTLENGKRAIIATLGISLDGTMRNKIGEIAEQRVQTLIVEWLVEKGLISSPTLTKEDIQDYEKIPRSIELKEGLRMVFSSEPDVSFYKGGVLFAVLEIKGGTDPAGALERYGAATKSFQSSVKLSSHCRNFYLGAVFTPELDRRIKADRLVEKTFNIIEILNEPGKRQVFFDEVFHHTLRLI